jgi:hypothetical protein
MNLKTIFCASVLAALAFGAMLAAKPVPDAFAGQTFTLAHALGKCELRVNYNSTYEATYASEGLYWHNEGKYRTTKTGIVLEPDICADTKGGVQVSCAQTLGRAECGYRDDNGSLYYTRFFACRSADNRKVLGVDSKEPDTILFPVEEFKVKPGAERTRDGVPVVTMGLAQAYTTSDVKIREAPSVDAKAFQYFISMFPDPTAKAMDYVPKGTQVTVIARTRETVQVGAWNNYWYLVSVGQVSEVWMFGEFVKIQ